MRWQQVEFVLKGIFLGLLLFVALQVDNWNEIALVGITTVGGLLLFLVLAAIRKGREGYRIKGRRMAFLLFLLLENPGLVYSGVMLGLLAGAVTLRLYNITPDWGFVERTNEDDTWRLLNCVAGGAFLGVVFWVLRHVKERKIRLGLSLVLGMILVGGTILLFYLRPALLSSGQKEMIGVLLLLGIPIFYLLTFASLVEESEVEVAAMCASLGLGVWLVGWDKMSDTFRACSLLMPLLLYVYYSNRILPDLRVFKHILRAVSYASVGRYRWALASLRRALELDSKNKWARDELWALHRQMDFEEIGRDPETLALIDFEMCLDRAALLLYSPPTDAQLHEATRLIAFVTSHRSDMLPRCDYWRAVAYTHRKQYEQAVECLRPVLAGSDGPHGSAHRQMILLAAWQFALTHPEMAKRIGHLQLQQPGRRMEAIAVIERQLHKEPTDTTTWDLKRFLYNDLHEADYDEAVPPGKAAEFFDHAYTQELGTALVKDPAQWERGAEYLRISARGLPHLGPSIFVQIAKAAEKAGNYKSAWENYELAKNAGRIAGPAILTAEDKKIYFQVVKMLADAKMEDGDTEAALENYKLYTEHESVGWETYRNLAELYERKTDPWSALHATEHALTYNPGDRGLLERKDKYYYSITPDQLKERQEAVFKWFDVDYCLTKSRALLDRHSGDMELLDWAIHLVELARVMRPTSFVLLLLRARILRLRGENAEAIQVLEEIRANKPEKFANSDEEEAWFMTNKMLGDLYLYEKPDLALECFLEFRKSPKSGADTSYKLGVAFEKLGDTAKAAKCYEQVTAYDKHPLYSAAVEALRRVRGAA